jgi:lipocalin
MARKPSISDEDYAAMVDFLKEQGYDTSKLQKVPHKPDD